GMANAPTITGVVSDSTETIRAKFSGQPPFSSLSQTYAGRFFVFPRTCAGRFGTKTALCVPVGVALTGGYTSKRERVISTRYRDAFASGDAFEARNALRPGSLFTTMCRQSFDRFGILDGSMTPPADTMVER